MTKYNIKILNGNKEIASLTVDCDSNVFTTHIREVQEPKPEVAKKPRKVTPSAIAALGYNPQLKQRDPEVKDSIDSWYNLGYTCDERCSKGARYQTFVFIPKENSGQPGHWVGLSPHKSISGIYDYMHRWWNGYTYQILDRETGLWMAGS